MAGKYGGEVDSFLYHLLGDEASAALHKEKVRASAPQADDLTAEDFPGFAGGPVAAAAVETGAPGEGVSDLPDFEAGFPVILQVRDTSWDGSEIAGFTPRSRVGDVVAGHATANAINTLAADSQVIRVDFSRDAGAPELDVSTAAVRCDIVHAPPVGETGSHALIGVIDGGIDVLHEAFRDAAGKSRIVACWDQIDPTGPPPVDQNGNPLYGTLHSREQIDTMIFANGVPDNLDRDPNGHGTHVTSIAAGRAAGMFAGGIAPEARIVFVRAKLYTPQNDPLSIGYSTSHVDGLAFIDRTAREYDLPVVVNISLGMNAGAHDGSSTLEAAFDNFTSSGRMHGRVLVKSAGNSAAQGLHGQFQIGEQQIIELQWRTEQMPRPSDVIEVWFNSCDDLEFSLIGPGGAGASAKVGRNLSNQTNGTFANGNDYSLAFDRFHRDNGDARLSIMVSRGGATLIEAGVWTLKVESRSVRSAGHVDAWIEQQRRPSAAFITQVSSNGTLSIPGTANTVITVAALDRQMLGQVMSFSSRGTTRDGRKRPDIGAPGSNIVAARSGTANDVVAMPGTSMAAPHVAGAVALLLSQQHKAGPGRQLNANQIRASLNQSSRGFNGHWNSARGWGMLDVKALLDLFR